MECGGHRVGASGTPARTSLRFLHPQIQNNEEGMQMVTEMGKVFRDVQLCWLGPVIPVLKLVDPAFIAPLLHAPGISPRIPTLGLFSVSYFDWGCSSAVEHLSTKSKL